MRFLTYLIVFLGIGFLLISCQKDPEPRVYKAEYAVVLVVDGPRYSENWGHPVQQYIPRMKNEMAQEGVIFTNFWNNGFTNTNPGHTAILTGHYQSINNLGGEIPQRPNYLKYWIKNRNKPSTDAWIIASKDKIEPLADCQDTAWAGLFLPRIDCGNNGMGSGYRSDSITLTHVLDTMEKHKPSLVFVNFRQPDYAGHMADWNNYLAAIQRVDQAYYAIWNYIRESNHYKNKTAFFVTNDHGRHLDEIGSFSGHGDDCEGCRHIFLYAYGPDFKSNTTVNTRYELIDIPTTLSEIMNLGMGTCDGKVIEELFQDD